MSTGIVREWHSERAWSVINSEDTPGGCWALFTAVQDEGYRGLVTGQAVVFDWEPTDMVNFSYRASRVRSAPAEDG